MFAFYCRSIAIKKCIACELKSEVANFKNELVLNSDRVYKFLGIKDDPEDLYYILKDLHGKILLSSCVGKVIPLCRRLGSEDYSDLMNSFELNDFEHRVVENESDNLICTCKGK